MDGVSIDKTFQEDNVLIFYLNMVFFSMILCSLKYMSEPCEICNAGQEKHHFKTTPLYQNFKFFEEMLEKNSEYSLTNDTKQSTFMETSQTRTNIA